MAKQKTTKRDARGRFAPGHKGGPGRPPAERETAYLRRLRQAVPVDQFEKIVAKLYKMASDGNLKAIELLCKYVLPEPTRRHEIDGSFADVEATRSDFEFRVAGASPSEVDAAAIKRLGELIEQRRADDARLAAQYRSAN